MVTPPRLSLINGTNGEQSEGDTHISFQDGAMRIDHPDGSTTIDFNGKPEPKTDTSKHDANLAKMMGEDELASIASDLIEGVMRDEESRQEWIDTRALGIALLGAKLEKPRTDAGLSGAPLEGMSTVRHPLLMEATVSFQATARAELLPAAGPVKVRNDAPPPPVSTGEDETSAAQGISDSLASKDLLSQALEKDMNHYLTYTASEYVPDTDRMLFYIGFGGDGFKKVYNCPIRRRPVSESVDAEDLIISNHATDMHNALRITHRIRMRESVLRRMQVLGVYRDIDLRKPSAPMQDPATQKKEETEGVTSKNTRPKDRDYEIYEVYTELDLDEFAPKKFKNKGVPLPYRVTLDKESKEILDLRRNWKEDDDEAMAKRFFVQFPFIRGLGFYGLGFIHLIGNSANALTAAWREMLDAGMFNCFPGFIYAKGAGRQNTNQFRVPPGGGVGIDVGAQTSIKDAIMPLPYKEPGAGFIQFIQHVEDVGRRLASTGNIQVGEGKQDAPVGTTLALIEQASKVMDSAHKRLHAAQAEEFKLLKERFREDPEAFWRHNKSPTVQWKKDQFVEALENCELVPVADPNNPTSLHRAAKAIAIQQMAQLAPDLFDVQAVALRVMEMTEIDPSGLLRKTPAAPPPDPRMAAVQAKAQAEAMKNQIAQLTMQIKAAELQASTQDKAQERASREKIEQMKIQLEYLRIKQEEVIHQNDMRRANMESQQEMMLDQHKHHQELQQNEQLHRQEMQHEQQMQQHNVALKQAEAQIKIKQAAQDAENSQQEAEQKAEGGRIKAQQDHEVDTYRQNLKLQREEEAHHAKMEREAETHESKLKQGEELNKAKVEVAKQLAKVQKSAKPKSEGKK